MEPESSGVDAESSGLDEGELDDELDDERAKSMASCITLETLHVAHRICSAVFG